jgi:stress-induced morphogen
MATRKKPKKKPAKSAARSAVKSTTKSRKTRVATAKKIRNKKTQVVKGKSEQLNPRKKGNFTIVAKLKPHLNLGPTPSLVEEDSIASVMMKRLRETLSPSRMNLANTSAQHASHRSAKKHGGAHYELAIVSDSFVGLSLVQREQWVTSLLSDLFDTKKIHALSMTLKTSEEEVGF